MKVFLSLFLLASITARAEFRIEKSGHSLRVFDGEALVTEYRTDWRVPYLYPLLLPSGANVTRHWPMREDVPGEERDHPHHRSLWLAHGSVNGFDFWAFADRKNASIEHRRFVDQAVEEDGAARFSVELVWTAEGKTHLLEKRTHVLRGSGTDTLIVDVISDLAAADADVVFGDTKEGMFALRFDRTLRLKGPEAKSHILNSEGATDGGAWGKRARWVAYHGPDEKGESAVIAIFDHPSNFRHPTWWHVRDYGLTAANPFGIHDFEANADKTVGNHTLKKGEHLRFRYRVVVHHGDLASAGLPARWDEFSRD